jgi:hypothetical protein
MNMKLSVISDRLFLRKKSADIIIKHGVYEKLLISSIRLPFLRAGYIREWLVGSGTSSVC